MPAGKPVDERTKERIRQMASQGMPPVVISRAILLTPACVRKILRNSR